MPTPLALRLRRFRERRRNGQACYRITLDQVDIEELLITARVLDQINRDDHAAVEDALRRFIAWLIKDDRSTRLG